MSTDYYYIKEHISRHINFYTSATVANRGRDLYRNKKVLFDDYIEKTDSWKFTVLGSKKYQVLIKGINSKNIQTTCTCPFDWGSICKHTVAALLFISDNLEERIVLQNPKQPETSLPAKKEIRKNLGFEIPDYNFIDISFVKKNVSNSVFRQIFYQRYDDFFDSIEVTNESLTFVSGQSHDNVKFYKEGEKVFVTSAEATNSSKLTTREAQCLSMIANSPLPNLLDEVFSGRILDKQKELLTIYGLPENTDLKEYFSFTFSEGEGILYSPTKEGRGLIPVTDNTGHYISDILRNLNNQEPELEKLPEKSEQRELGFVIKRG